MELFNRMSGPVFYKNDSEAEALLGRMKELLSVPGVDTQKLEHEIHLVELGIRGEKQVHFELENSHIPMYVLHDLYLEHNGLTAQIDYLIITKKLIYVVECKNLYGNIEINSNGDFIRTVKVGQRYHKEGIYSPITQNRRHLELIKALRSENKNILSKLIFEKAFYENYRSVVVLSNPQTVLNARYAKREIRDQVIRADQLAEFIRRNDAEAGMASLSQKNMEELAADFLQSHKAPTVDRLERFRPKASAEPEEKPVQAEPAAPEKVKEPAVLEKTEEVAAPKQEETMTCPQCGAPMIKRKASRGANAGNQFWGCSKFPKCRGIVNIP